MVFEKKDVVFIGSSKLISKTGKELCFIKIADPSTYENLELMPVLGLDVSKLVVGGVYNAQLHCSGRYSNVMLTKV